MVVRMNSIIAEVDNKLKEIFRITKDQRITQLLWNIHNLVKSKEDENE